jgi:hypothetical protein
MALSQRGSPAMRAIAKMPIDAMIARNSSRLPPTTKSTL